MIPAMIKDPFQRLNLDRDKPPRINKQLSGQQPLADPAKALSFPP